MQVYFLASIFIVSKCRDQKIPCMKLKFIQLIAASVALSMPLISVAQCGFSGNIETIAGNHSVGYTGDGGIGTSAQMRSPYSVAVSPLDGDVFIADYFNNVVRRLSHSTGMITTYAGTGVKGFNGDGLPSTMTQLAGPTGLRFDPAGNLYIADKFNERIRKVNLMGIVSTVAGNGLHGGWQGAAFGNGGPATAAALTYPVAIAFNCAGDMYIADQGSQTVRMIDHVTGIITRFAGTHKGAYNNDGIPATAAHLNHPTDIAVDCGNGDVYISDTWNNRIRKVNNAGVISTVAGNGTAAYSGDGGYATSASIFGPWGIMLDGCGDLYICDYDNYVVRKVSGGNISTVAGLHLRRYTGNGGSPAEAGLYLPASIARSASGEFYIADFGNLVVRSIGGPTFGGRAFNGGTTQIVHTCKNSSGISVDKLLSTADAAGQTENWTLSVEPENGTVTPATGVVAENAVVTPTGFVYVPKNDFTGTDEFTVLMSDGATNASTTITVIVDEVPEAGAISQSNIAGNVISLTSSGNEGGTWTSSNPSIATVDANGYVTAVTNGVVTIEYTVNNNCGSKSASANIVSQVSEIAANKFVVFPNPNNGSFRFDFMAAKADAMTLVANDVTGRLIYSETMDAVEGINTFKISMPENLPRPSLVWLTLRDSKGLKVGSAAVTLQK